MDETKVKEFQLKRKHLRNLQREACVLCRAANLDYYEEITYDMGLDSPPELEVIPDFSATTDDDPIPVHLVLIIYAL